MAQKTVSLNISITAEDTVIDYCILAYAEAHGWISLAESGVSASAFTSAQLKQNIIAALKHHGAEKAQRLKQTELVGFT